MSEITTGIITTENQIIELLALQQTNLKKNISKEEMADQGFVTVEHNFEKLNAMNKEIPQIIALKDNKVVGYALSMTVSLKTKIPELIPMFELLENLNIESQALRNSKYYVMGQICIEKSVRGQGVFQKLYQAHSQQFGPDFDYLITEVSVNNKRSMRAHEKVGFKTIHEYFDPENNDTWAVVAWDLGKES